MGNWVSPTVTLEPINFDGDSIVFKARRLTVASMSKLAGHFDGSKLSFATQLDLAAVAATVLPDHIEAQAGWKKPDGSEFSREEFVPLFGEFYFAPLVGELLTKLIDASTVRDAKN